MSKKSIEPVKQLEKSASEKRAIEALRSAEVRRRERDKFRVGVYAPKLKDASFFGIPFYAKTDTLAALAFRSCIEMEHNDSTLVGADLYFIGYYDSLTGKMSAREHRFITY